MNYIPVDVSVVEKLYSEGRILYDRIHPVKSLEQATEAASKGRLFMRCAITDKELDKYFDIKREIARLEALAKETEKKLVAEAEIAMEGKPFRMFELESAQGKLSVTSRSKLCLEQKFAESLFHMLGDREDGVIKREVVYSPTSAFSKTITPFLDGKIMVASVEDGLKATMQEIGITDLSVEDFSKKIGKTFSTRVGRMMKHWGVEKVVAQHLAEMIENCENWSRFTDMYIENGNGVAMDDYMGALRQWCKVDHSVAVKSTI